jgi:hypothetical protein
MLLRVKRASPHRNAASLLLLASLVACEETPAPSAAPTGVDSRSADGAPPARSSDHVFPSAATLDPPLSFHGYDCTVDCSGHEAGYKWAEDHDIDDADDCGGNSESFIEGCRSYAEEQEQKSDDDDSSHD